MIRECFFCNSYLWRFYDYNDKILWINGYLLTLYFISFCNMVPKILFYWTSKIESEIMKTWQNILCLKQAKIINWSHEVKFICHWFKFIDFATSRIHLSIWTLFLGLSSGIFQFTSLRRIRVFHLLAFRCCKGSWRCEKTKQRRSILGLKFLGGKNCQNSCLLVFTPIKPIK